MTNDSIEEKPYNSLKERERTSIEKIYLENICTIVGAKVIK